MKTAPNTQETINRIEQVAATAARIRPSRVRKSNSVRRGVPWRVVRL